MPYRHLLTLLALFLTTGSVHGDQSSHDWKYFGSSGPPNAGEEWFYLPGEISRLSGGMVQVWTESISSQEILAYVSQQTKDGPLMTQVRAEGASGYLPPYAIIRHMTADHAKAMILLEVVADSNEITPDGSTLYTLDCRHKKYRADQQISLDSDGNQKTSTASKSWELIVPETLTDALYSLVCKA